MKLATIVIVLVLVILAFRKYADYRVTKARRKLDAVLDDITARGGTVNREKVLARMDESTPDAMRFKQIIRESYPEEIPFRDAHELKERLEEELQKKTSQ